VSAAVYRLAPACATVSAVNRREFLRAIASAGVVSALAPVLACAGSPRPETLPATGRDEPKLRRFDEWVRAYMAEHRIPGAALAIARAGRVVYARGFGYADRAQRVGVEPESWFRIAGVSVPFTSAAILRLVDEKRLRIRDPVLDHLGVEPFLAPGVAFDERWRKVTVRHCLTHTGGWDRERSGDPMFDDGIARALGLPLPLVARDVVRWQLGRPLDFEPGERWAYSNFGYAVLGRVIESVTGQPYEAYVRSAILAPLGLDGPRIGRSHPRARGEVKYYTLRGGRVAETPVPWVQTMDACGGWIASAIDLVRFGAAFDLVDEGRATRGGILQPKTVRRMLSGQVPMTPPREGFFVAHYGYGWVSATELNAFHSGGFISTVATLLHLADGTNIAFLGNQGQSSDGAFLSFGVADALSRLVVETWDWPDA
jgi:CubicO group peptidase (beta-lactamase class C family)